MTARPQMADCQVVRVVMLPPNGGSQILGDTLVPAYTRTPASLRERVGDLLTLYIQQSLTTGDKASLGDFGLFLLAKASNEPKRQLREERSAMELRIEGDDPLRSSFTIEASDGCVPGD